MSHSRFTAEDYVQWLIAEPKWATMTEASRCSPAEAAHDSWRRLLLRQATDSGALWEDVQALVDRTTGCLILDDSTLDKPYGPKIELVSWHWSGKHKKVVQGINLVTLLWTDGERFIPVDYRIYHKATDGKTKNDHFTEMLKKAQERGFQPTRVLFDSWYASVKNLKCIRKMGWTFLTRLPANRIISLNRDLYVKSGELLLQEGVSLNVHLRQFGFIRVFQTVPKDADVRHWMTNDLEMEEAEREELGRIGFSIENYHRALKQECCVERCQARRADIQRVHIGMAIRAFVRLEVQRIKLGLSYWELGRQIIRDAVRAYLLNPLYVHHPTA